MRGGSGESSYLWRIETCTILVKQFITYQWRVFYELCHLFYEFLHLHTSQKPFPIHNTPFFTYLWDIMLAPISAAGTHGHCCTR